MEEVHLWRGTPQQRTHRFNTRESRNFAYFDHQLEGPDWRGKKVLDFGGNVGAILLEEDCQIEPENYYCVDVIREALEIGRARFPYAHWVHYDRYNYSFNPEGIRDLPIPDLGVEFDIVFAYSVFTHTTREEMHDLVGQLQSRLAPAGALAFTVIDPHFVTSPETYPGSNLRWRLQRCRAMNSEVDVDRLVEESKGADWCALTDGSELHINGNGNRSNEPNACVTYHVFYTVRELQRQFPGATIRAPVNGSMHHCVVMQRRK